MRIILYLAAAQAAASPRGSRMSPSSGFYRLVYSYTYAYIAVLLFIRVMALNCTDGAVRYISLVKILIIILGRKHSTYYKTTMFLLPRAFMF